MAERTIAVKMTIDGKQSIQELENIQEAMATIEDELRNLDKASAQLGAEEAFRELNNIIDENVLSFQELGTAADNYKNIALAAGKETPVGQKALAKAAEMERQMSDLTMEVDHLAQRGQSLQSAMTLGETVIAGYSAFEDVQASLGLENVELEETFMKLQGAMATMQGLQEVNMALSKESILLTKGRAIGLKVLAGAQKAYSLVVGTSTGAMKAFKIALASTGIGLLIVGLGMLIANFDKIVEWVQKAGEKFGGLKNVLLALLGPIGWIIIAYQKLFGETEAGMKSQIELQKEANIAAEEAHKKRIKELEQQAEKQRDLIEAIQERQDVQTEVHDLALLQAKAKGASETELFELQKQQNEAKLALAKQEWEAKQELIRINHEMAEAEYNRLKTFLETQAKISGWTDEMIAKDLERLEKAKQQYLEDEQARIDSNERAIKTMEAQNQIFINKRNKQLSDQAEKEKQEKDAENKAKQEKEAAANKAKLEKEAAYQKELEDLRVANMKDSDKRELKALKLKFERRRKEIVKQYGEGTELETELIKQRDKQLSELEDKLEKAHSVAEEAQAETDKAKFEAKLEEANRYVEKAQMALDVMTEISGLLDQISEERIEKNQAERDQELEAIAAKREAALADTRLEGEQKAKLEHEFAMMEWRAKVKAAKADDREKKKQFKRNKALQIATATINTASAVLQAIAQFGPPPSPMGIAGISAAGVIGGVQIAKIASQKFKGTAGSIAPPTLSLPSPGSGGGSSSGGGKTQESNLQNDTGTSTSDLLQPKLQVSVVEIENTMTTVNEIDKISTL